MATRYRVRGGAKAIERAILEDIEDHPAVEEANGDLAEDAAAYWAWVSPVDTGEYVDLIDVEPRPDHNKLPAHRVTNTDDKAEYLEFGTGGNTPTPAFAPRAETVIKFGGSL